MIYGDLLLAFPEQMRSISVFDMTAKMNGGWAVDESSRTTVRGIFQNTRGNQTKDQNGNLVQSQGVEFWSKTGDLNGKFATIQNKVYRLTSSNDWNFEGGFFRYSLEKVIGNDGTESINTAWNTGVNSFS